MKLGPIATLSVLIPVSALGFGSLGIWMGGCEQDFVSQIVPASFSAGGSAPDMTPGSPIVQGTGPADVAVTERIEAALQADSSLSTLAKNVTVVTGEGTVRIRGSVKSEIERAEVASTASRYAGTNDIEDRLDVGVGN